MQVNSEGEDLLYNLAYECEGLFDQLQEAFQKTKSETATVELCAEFQQRFAVWAAHLGVFARKSQCLDTRLRNHPDLQDLVARLLDVLRRSLQQCTIEVSNQTEGDAVSTAALKTIDDTLTRLNRLGVTIRQSGRSKFDARANKFAAGLDLGSFASLCANAVQALYPGAHHQHVDRDLKPYTCLYEGCQEAHPAYPTFDEWFKHMELHDWRWHQQVYLTSSWACTVCEFNPDVYSSPQALYSHLEESHSSDFSSAQLQAISRQSKTEQPRASNDCLLCCFAVQEQGNNDEAVFPKRRKEQPKQEASKSARKALEMTNPHPHSSDLEFSDTSSDSDDLNSHQSRKQRNKDRSKAVARHVAVHLQVLMLLTLRFAAALQDDDGDLDDGTKSDSVDIDEGNSASLGTDLGRLSHIASEADVTMKDGHDRNDAENNESAMDLDEDVDNDAVDEETPVPDTDLDLDFIPRQYDDLVAKDDKFLSKVIESGAYQSWQAEPPALIITPPPPGSDVVQEEADRYYRESIIARTIAESQSLASSKDEEYDPRGKATHSSPSSKSINWGENSTKHFEVEPPESHTFIESENELAEVEEKPKPRDSKVSQWGMIAASVAAGTAEPTTAGFDPNIVIDDPAFRRRDSPPGINETPPGIYETPVMGHADPGDEVREEYRSPYDAPNADVRIDNEIYPDDIQRFTGAQDATKVVTFKSRDPSCERDRPMLNLVRPTPVASPASFEPLNLDQDKNGPGTILRAIDVMIKNHIWQLQNSDFFTLLDQLRKALLSFQRELHSLSKSQAMNAIDTSHSRSLSDIHHELKFTLQEQESFLSTEMIKDPNYSKAFCKSLIDYKTRLTAIKNEILKGQETEPFSQSEIEARSHWVEANDPGITTDSEVVPLEMLQVKDDHYRKGARILIRSLPNIPSLRLNSGGDNHKWLALRADGASPNSPKHKVLAITQGLIDAKCTIRIPGSIGDNLSRPPLCCELYYEARDIVAFLNRSDVPVSLIRMSHTGSTLNEYYTVKPRLSKSLRPGTFRLEMRDVAVLDIRILGKRPTAAKPVASSGKWSSQGENREEANETEDEFFIPRLKRVGHVDFDKISQANTEIDRANAEIRKRQPVPPPTPKTPPPAAPGQGLGYEATPVVIEVHGGYQAREEEEQGEEEEAQRQRLRQRMNNQRRSSTGSNTRRHRVIYDDGRYRWE
ncbi:hypothetical protein GGI35DRAFT_485370 [Trichoderma velutinum]